MVKVGAAGLALGLGLTYLANKRYDESNTVSGTVVNEVLTPGGIVSPQEYSFSIQTANNEYKVLSTLNGKDSSKLEALISPGDFVKVRVALGGDAKNMESKHLYFRGRLEDIEEHRRK